MSYEPILYFSSVEESERLQPRRGSWSQEGKWSLRNGLGLLCSQVHWKASIKTDGCSIADPSPHIDSTNESFCWAWTQEVLSGERGWCRDNSKCSFCESGAAPTAEMCIKWHLVTYVTVGLSRLVVAERPSVQGDIELPKSVSFQSMPFGSEATYPITGNVCARSGPLRP